MIFKLLWRLLSNSLFWKISLFILIISNRPLILLPYNQAFADFQDEIPDIEPLPPPSFPTTPGKTPTSSKPEEQKESIPPRPSTKKPTTSPHTPKKPKKTPDFTSHNSNAPVNFEGREGSRTKGVITLTGDVVITQDDLRLTSNYARIFSAPDDNSKLGVSRVDKAVATGNVHVYKKGSIESPEIHAQADEIRFFPTERLMILEGHAKVQRNMESVSAEVMEINLATGDIKLHSPKGIVDPRSTRDLKNGEQDADR